MRVRQRRRGALLFTHSELKAEEHSVAPHTGYIIHTHTLVFPAPGSPNCSWVQWEQASSLISTSSCRSLKQQDKLRVTSARMEQQQETKAETIEQAAPFLDLLLRRAPGRRPTRQPPPPL